VDINRNKAIVQRFDQVTSSGDLDELDELCTPDLVNHALAGDRPAGLEGTKAFLSSCRRGAGFSRWLRSMVDDQSVSVVGDDDLVVQFGVRQGNWPGGFFRGFNIPSGVYAYDVAFMYRLVDGRIAERWAVRDDLGMMLQLGALTAGETERSWS
jgi:ketosteroid isomerase-like protein